MKTKILLALIIFTFIFNLSAQISPNITLGNDNHTAKFSPNGEYVAVLSDGNIGGIVPSGDGLLRLYHRNIGVSGEVDNTFLLEMEYIIPKGTTSSAAVAIQTEGLAVSDSGDWFIFIQDDHISGIGHYNILRNGTGSNVISIDNFTISIGVESMCVQDGAVYITGLIEDGSVTRYLKKYDTSTNELLWSVNPGTAPFPKIIKKEGMNVHMNMDGDLVEFDDATGANLGVVVDGLAEDIYQINDDDEIEIYHGSNHTIKKLIFPNAEMDWGQYNFWADSGISKWNTGNGKTYGLNGSYMRVMSDKLVHGFKDAPFVPTSAGVDQYLDSHIFDDGSVTFITFIDGDDDDDDVIDIRHVEYPIEVEVPTLNGSDSIIESVHNGHRYIGSTWYDTYERVGTIVLNGTMPDVGDTVPFNWVNTVSGYTMIQTGDVAPHVEIDAEGNLFVRYVFYKNGFTSYLNNLRVYLIHSSTVSVSENEFDTISIYPNPVNTNLTIQNAELITEINVFNTLGQIVIKRNYFDNSVKKYIDVSQLENGIYTIQVKSKIGIMNKKFVKN